MKDQEYLQTYINALKIVEGERIMVVTQATLEFAYVTAGYKKYITDEDMIGVRVKDSNHPGKEAAEEFRQISLKVLATKASASFFVIYKFPKIGNTTCFIYTLAPIINPHSENVVGLMGEFQILDPSIISKMFGLIFSFAFPKVDTPELSEISLTVREKEILFLLTLGYGHKEISYILSRASKKISPNTVNTIIRRQLFKKFHVSTTSELIIKSGQSKALNKIPSSIIELNYGVYDITYTR